VRSTRTRKLKKERSKIITYSVYAFVLGIAVISTISVIFPALFPTTVIENETEIDPFELGIWAIPVILTNIVVFTFVFLYYKKILPNKVINSLNFLKNFDISPKVAAIILITMLGIYIGLSYEELFIDEFSQWPDFYRISLALQGWPFDSQAESTQRVLYVKNFLLKTSEVVFQNFKIVPFIGTNAMLIVTYFFYCTVNKKEISWTSSRGINTFKFYIFEI